MTAYRIWLRRGSGRLLFVVLSAFLLVTMFSQPDWRVEFDWATRLTAAPMILLSTGIAALAAFDTSRRLRPTLSQFGRGAVRGAWHLSLPAAAVATWAVAAYVFIWTVAAITVWHSGGVGVHDWWVFAEVVAPLVGAASLGFLAGMSAGPLLAPVLAAVTVITAAVLVAPWGRGPFEAVTTFGTLTGLERVPARAAAVVLGALLLALGALVAGQERNRVGGARRPVALLTSALMVLAAVAPAAWPWKADIYRFTTEPYGCVGSSPAVCGPQSRLVLLSPVQRSLAQAYVTLRGTDFVRPKAFRITRIDHYSDLDGAAPLDFDPTDVKDGQYDHAAVARALFRPHQCDELFSAREAGQVLDAGDVVLPWLTAVLNGRADPSPVPADVSAAFDVVLSCRQRTWDR